jgi:hypothetical protein
MRALSFRCVAAAVLINICVAAGALRPNNESADDLPPFNVDRWLNGPNREDFPWGVQVSAPTLTLQQRYVVQVRAFFYIRRGILKNTKIPQDLHFVLKVAPEGYNWVPQYSYTRIPFPSKEDEYNILEFTKDIYLRPGTYTIALIACDPVLDKGNVWREQVKVAPLKRDKLPELDRNLRSIEFASKERPLAMGREWLPVKNNRSLCIDIVANTSMDWHNNPRLGRWYQSPGPPIVARDKSKHILQVASVLSHLGVRKGRVRVSIVDALRTKTLFNREDAADFDWQRASRSLKTETPSTIDIDLLASQTQASAYLYDTLQEILEDNACASGTELPLKIVIVVSTDMVFPEDTPIRQIVLPNRDSVRFFYFKIPKGIPANDDLHKMLEKTKPKAFTVRNGSSFRMDLADLISRLEKFAN